MSKNVIIVSFIRKETIVMKLKQVVKCYDTLSGIYVEVPVSQEIEEFIKRSYWREDMQERRYYQRIVSIDSCIPEGGQIPSCGCSVLDEVIQREEKAFIAGKVDGLNAKYKEVFKLVYIKGLSMTEAARSLGVSVSYVSRLLKEARAWLAQEVGGMQ